MDITKLLYKNTRITGYEKYRQYITAIKSKPFLLLAGISGTGKSRIVRELARSCWAPDSEEYQAQKPRNFEMIQVKPNWHDSSELLGYVSRINGEKFIVGPFLKFMAAAIKEPDVPYFLCLDEMNLAPVEQYFAEYLSVIESRKAKNGTIVTDPIINYEPTEAYIALINELFPNEEDEGLAKEYKYKGGKELTIPQNLIVVGTVNMDETTFSFSRKVLDRAMTIEMNEVDLWGGLTNKYEPIGQQSIDTLIGTAVEGSDVYNDYETICETCLEYLKKVNAELEGTPFKIAYRTRNEVLLYVVNNLPYDQSENGDTLSNDYVIARALDEITNMKILSRIEGDETRVKKDLLKDLIETIKEGLTSITGLQYGAKAKNTDEEQVEKSISIAKLEEMAKKLSESGYTSYWS
ncbi:MAG: AAA family ATPase [Porphyromonas somerae]|uniref:McrB family protein n=1 Tax=Porphyromonas somerae TaxID=322095 RepID=UPI0026F0D8F4|nr:AAA family ATPase [Porphyromonas somerae]MDD7557688.1 AAA family ATPase [Porphyromonas somerae]MDY5814998.1 AAA family ATPase [Porphyromonas somerae]